MRELGLVVVVERVAVFGMDEDMAVDLWYLW